MATWMRSSSRWSPEHSAIERVLRFSSAAGARTFTATASQGLALMSEIVFNSLLHEAPYSDVPRQSCFERSSFHLERSFRHDDGEGLRLDSGVLQEMGQEVMTLSSTRSELLKIPPYHCP